MRVALRVALPVIASLGLLGLGAAHASAAGTVTSQTMAGIATPVAQSASVRGPASLTLSMDTTYDGTPPFAPKMTSAEFRLDDDFQITPGTTAQCDPDAAGFGTSTIDAALAACPGAYLGTGNLTMDGPVPLTGITTAFNGTPGPGSVPRILIHLRTAANTTTVLVAEVTSSALPADHFQVVEFVVPIFPIGVVIDHLDFRIGEPGSPSAGTYFTARCADTPAEWNYIGTFGFDNMQTMTDSHAQRCSATPITPGTPITPITPDTPAIMGPLPSIAKSKAKKKKKKRKKKKK